MSAKGIPYADELITVTSAAVVAPTVAVMFAGGRSPGMAELSVEGGDLRYRVTGGDPDNSPIVGHRMAADQAPRRLSPAAIGRLKMIAVTTDSSVFITYYT